MSSWGEAGVQNSVTAGYRKGSLQNGSYSGALLGLIRLGLRSRKGVWHWDGLDMLYLLFI